VRLRLRFTLPSVLAAIAIAVTMSIFSRPESETYVYMNNFDLQLGFALNAPATALRYCLERLAMQFCPATYQGNPWTGCYPLAPIFETVVYFGLVWLLWYAVALEVAGRGQSTLTPRTGRRGLADTLSVLFGAFVGVFGVLSSNPMGSPVRSLLVGVTYLLWALAIIVFYGRDLWVHFRTRQNKTRLADTGPK
jgi:hypothetical protein